MAYSAGELANLGASLINWNLTNKGKSTFPQKIAQKPLFNDLRKKMKPFPAGKDSVDVKVKMDSGSGGVVGFTHNDTVSYDTAANTMTASFAWRELHIGLQVYHTELKSAGISVSDSGETSNHSGRDAAVLVELFNEKLDDFNERYAKSMDIMLHGDGTADPKGLLGLAALIAANPTTGTLGGISRATYPVWRNLAYTAAHAAAGGTGAITSSTANGGALIQNLGKIARRLTVYGGKLGTIYAGADWIDAYETEIRANGNYTMTGFRASQDPSMGELYFMGCKIVHDPTLTYDLSLPKRAYWVDTDAITLRPMTDEWEVPHTPARPPGQYVLNKGLTCTGVLLATRVNSSAVIDIA